MKIDFSRKLPKVIVIAEAGINHNGRLDYALKLADIAKECGADYVKYQLISSSTCWNISNEGDVQLRALIAKNMLSFEDYCKVFDHCSRIGIGFLCSPADVPSARLLSKLPLDAIKISSSNSTNYHLLSEVCNYSIPIILSSGISSTDEIVNSIQFVYQESKIIPSVLYCISDYPTKLESISFTHMTSLFDQSVALNCGFSDHSLSHAPSIIAVSKGATIIEKHFTIDKSLEGPDHSVSLSATELRQFIDLIRDAQLSSYEHKQVDALSVNRSAFGRSMYATRNMMPNDIIGFDDIAGMRPANSKGVSSDNYISLIGKKVLKPISAFDLIHIDFVIDP